MQGEHAEGGCEQRGGVGRRVCAPAQFLRVTSTTLASNAAHGKQLYTLGGHGSKEGLACSQAAAGCAQERIDQRTDHP